MITNYQIVWAESTSLLSEKIRLEIESGWQPIGGVSETEGRNDKVLVQALVKYE